MSQQFRNCPVSCPIAASAQPQRSWVSWTLSATTTALILSAASALALTSNQMPAIVETPVYLTLPPAPAAADTMAAMTDPAPIANSEAPIPPQLQADAPQPEPLPDMPEPEPVAQKTPPPLQKPQQLTDARPETDAEPPPPDPLPTPDALPAAADAPPKPLESAKPKAEQQTPRKVEAKPETPKKKPEKAKNTKSKKADEPTPKKATKASAAPAAGAASAQAKGSKAAAQGQSPKAYNKAVLKKIRGVKKRSGVGKGRAVVGFVISANGGLSLVKIVQSSGVAALDAAAVDHIKRAAPFPPPPDGGKVSLSTEFVGQ
ncbi:TonB family protein [Cypionkella sp.]|uniref:TonB family protein n=1 Tax=Cypionkella sp. TaxID=2811411 RepID=UPI0026279770|nr:TonB family protein [Cypionkella sp.]MDB5665492.1 hypothetical protein [Cypionkella sp.]